MRAFFADTGYWVALINRRDALHVRAGKLSFSPVAERIVTSELVLAELLNGVSVAGAHIRDSASQVAV